MGQLLHHEFQLDKLSPSTQLFIKSKIYRELPINHRQILIQTAKRIVEKQSAMKDFYELDINESGDLGFMSDGAAYYAAEYLLKKNFKVDDEYKHIVDEIYSNVDLSTSVNIVSKYQNIMHINNQRISVSGGNGESHNIDNANRYRYNTDDRNDSDDILDLANKIKQSVSMDNYIRLLRVFIISMAHENE